MKNNKISNTLHNHETYLFIITVVIFIFFSFETGGLFISGENLRDMISSVAMEGIMAAGVLIVLISGGIDISFMAIACVVQYVTSFYLINIENTYIIVAVLIAVFVGVALGILNGALVYVLKVPAIIVTIATMNIYYGILIWLSKGRLLNNFPKWFSVKSTFSTGILPAVLIIAVFLLTALILRKTKLGRSIFAIGGNVTAARRIGVSVLKIQLVAYGYLGLLSAVGGLLQMYLSQTVAPNTLVGNEMNVLAMVVLGGAALTGGKGTAVGTFIGVMLIGAIGNGMVLIGISSYWFDFVTGFIVLFSFCVTGYGLKKKNKGRTICID